MSDKIIASWEKNASEWIKVIQNDAIPSRKFTNAAIVETIKGLSGKKALDVGCGEGWLTREMGNLGWDATGLDATEKLVLEARSKSSQNFEVFTYEDIMEGKSIPYAPFDIAVFNFCLYQEHGLHELLSKILEQLSSKGTIVIQTLHPYFLLQNGLSYKSQWLSDSWKGLPGNFTDGHSWYARTFADWSTELNLLSNTTNLFNEVVNDQGIPISLIIKISKI